MVINLKYILCCYYNLPAWEQSLWMNQ